MSDKTKTTSGGNPPVSSGYGRSMDSEGFTKHNEISTVSPFAKLAKLSRSPPPVSNLPPQYKPGETQTPQIETIASHVN